MMFRESDKKLCFSFSVGLDVSKIFSPHYTGVGPYLIVSRTTDILYLRYYKYNFSTTDFGESAVFVVYKSVSQFYFGVCGFLFVKQMKREPTANTPKKVKKIAPSSSKSKNS